MFNCTYCTGGNQFTSGQAFLAHFSFFHSKIVASGSMVCSHTECFGRKFSKFNSFRKHVLNKHKDTAHSPSSYVTSSSQRNLDVNVNGSSSSETCTQEIPVEHSSETQQVETPVVPLSTCVTFDEALTSSVITFIASLYDCGSFTESQIQFIIDGHRQLLGAGFLLILKENVLSLLSKSKDANVVTESDYSNASRMFESCHNMFDGFETQYLRTKEVENSGAYIKPESFVIGHAQDIKTVNGHSVVEPIELTGQFVPLRHVLKGFLELPGVLRETLDYVSYLENSYSEFGPVENIIQAELWRTKIKPLFPNKCLLPLIFNFDDYETNKELGTHTCVHKLGAGYIQIACLPPMYQSALENIFLAVLFHSNDRAFGNNKVFRKVLNELKYLEENGITVVTSEGVTQVYFALCLVTGDNLGANGILGFVESFSANYFCRICFEEKNVTKHQVEANPDKRRTPESYANDLRINNVTLTGRKGECVFNELEAYDVSENVHCDIMHDLDEGVWKYVMYEIVKYLYDKKRFSIDYLNELIQGFCYGCNEEKNRLPSISKDDLCKSKRLRFSASEMRFFVRYFGLMVGHVVLEEDMDVWQLYLKARCIADIVYAPKVLKEDVNVLKNLIKEHHSEFLRIFGIDLKPKFHFAIHEPDLMTALGPLDRLSCYRTEHKHKEGKDVAHSSNNRINLPFTIAKRHQLRVAFRLLAGRGFKQKFEYSVLNPVMVKSIKEYQQFQNSIPADHHVMEWSTAKWLKINGTKYVLGSVVLVSINNDLSPVFGQVRVISICKNNQAYFVLQLLDVVKFESHVHAFEVKTGSNWLFVRYNNLLTHVPTDIRVNQNGKSYVPFRFSVACFSK